MSLFFLFLQVMQTTVPQPYDIQGKKAPSHLNMPGGQWAQNEKYISGDLQDNHCNNLNKKNKRGTTLLCCDNAIDTQTLKRFYCTSSNFPGISSQGFLFENNSGECINNKSYYSQLNLRNRSINLCALLNPNSCFKHFSSQPLTVHNQFLHYHSFMQPEFHSHIHCMRSFLRESSHSTQGQSKLTQRQKLKLAVRDYGSTVVIFHITVGLLSLGFFYLLVSR